jgi:diguanylate cyclase (GGDEF)-like protein/PAS domain S-box-containing protein
MQGPVVDLVLLMLLILFFGVQQWRRPQVYFRFWFVGWIFVFLSYMVWAVGVAPARLERLQSVVCYDFLLLGVLCFLMSLVAKEHSLKRVVLSGLALGAAGMVVVNTQEFIVVPRLVLAVGVLMAEGVAYSIAYMLLPERWTRRRALILTICVGYGLVLLAYVLLTPATNLDSVTVVEVLLCAAVLYAGSAGRRGVSGWAGTLGFAAWAVFYLLNIRPDASPESQRVLYEFWNFPKYFVGFSMILKVFEDTANDKARMAETFRDLYEDFRLLYDTHPHPMWICDAAEGRFLTANEAAVKEYGYGVEELQAMRMSEIEVPGDAEADEVESVLGQPTEGMRVRHRHKDGRVVWVNVVEREIVYLGQEARLVIARNITERLKLDRELSYRAQHDALTGLPNRQLLEERLDQCLQLSRVEDRRAAVLTIDVDHFKLINDTYGHLVGDECLKEVAARLKSKIRKVDTIARTGGEEFTAVVSGLSKPSDAEKVAASLMRVFEAPVELAFGALGITVSIGVAVYPDDATDATTLRRLSDEAMYRAKRAGRNRAAYTSERTPVLDFKKPAEAS